MFTYPLLGEAPNNFVFPIDYQSGSIDINHPQNFTTGFGTAGSNIPAGVQVDSANQLWPSGITGSFWIKPTGYSSPVTVQFYDQYGSAHNSGQGNGDGTTTFTENSILGLYNTPASNPAKFNDAPWMYLHQDSAGATMLRWVFTKSNDSGSDNVVGYEVELPQNQFTHVLFNHVFWRESTPNALYHSYMQCYLNGVAQNSEDSASFTVSSGTSPATTFYAPNGWISDARLALVGTKNSSYRVCSLATADNIPYDQKWRIGGSRVLSINNDNAVQGTPTFPKFKGELAQIYIGDWSQDLQFNVDLFYNNGAVNLGPSGITSGAPAPRYLIQASTAHVLRDIIPVNQDSASENIINGTLSDTTFNV